MSSFLDRAGKQLYDKTLGRDRSQMQFFSIFDAWEFLAGMAKEHPQVDSCTLDISREGDHYLILMVVFNERGEPIYTSGDRVVARKLIAFNLSADLVRYMDGRRKRNLYVSTLTTPPAQDPANDEDEDE